MRIEYNFRSGAEVVDTGSEEAKGGEEKGGDEGGAVSCLTELISAQSLVKELSLRGNQLDSLAGVAIARAVANNASLKVGTRYSVSRGRPEGAQAGKRSTNHSRFPILVQRC